MTRIDPVIEQRRRLQQLADVPMEPLEYLAIMAPQLYLDEHGARAQAARILASAIGLEKPRSIQSNWGDNFEKCPRWAKIALRRNYLLNKLITNHASTRTNQTPARGSSVNQTASLVAVR